MLSRLTLFGKSSSSSSSLSLSYISSFCSYDPSLPLLFLPRQVGLFLRRRTTTTVWGSSDWSHRSILLLLLLCRSQLLLILQQLLLRPQRSSGFHRHLQQQRWWPSCFWLKHHHHHLLVHQPQFVLSSAWHYCALQSSDRLRHRPLCSSPHSRSPIVVARDGDEDQCVRSLLRAGDEKTSDASKKRVLYSQAADKLVATYLKKRDDVLRQEASSARHSNRRQRQNEETASDAVVYLELLIAVLRRLNGISLWPLGLYQITSDAVLGQVAKRQPLLSIEQWVKVFSVFAAPQIRAESVLVAGLRGLRRHLLEGRRKILHKMRKASQDEKEVSQASTGVRRDTLMATAAVHAANLAPLQTVLTENYRKNEVLAVAQQEFLSDFVSHLNSQTDNDFSSRETAIVGASWSIAVHGLLAKYLDFVQRVLHTVLPNPPEHLLGQIHSVSLAYQVAASRAKLLLSEPNHPCFVPPPPCNNNNSNNLSALVGRMHQHRRLSSVTSSVFHQLVSSILTSRKVAHSNEHVTAEGLSIDICILSPLEYYNEKIALECDGGSHFVLTLHQERVVGITASSSESSSFCGSVALSRRVVEGFKDLTCVRDSSLPTGKTILKRNLLRQFGWIPISVPVCLPSLTLRQRRRHILRCLRTSDSQFLANCCK